MHSTEELREWTEAADSIQEVMSELDTARVSATAEVAQDPAPASSDYVVDVPSFPPPPPIAAQDRVFIHVCRSSTQQRRSDRWP